MPQTQTKEALRLSETDPQGEYDSHSTVYVYAGTIPQVLEALNLPTYRRASFNEDEPGKERSSQYKASDLWYRSRDRYNKQRCLRISVDVGCFCEHDCCGCCCGLRYEITPLGEGMVAVLCHSRYNY